MRPFVVLAPRAVASAEGSLRPDSHRPPDSVGALWQRALQFVQEFDSEGLAVVVTLVLVGFALVGWVVAGRIVERFASLGSRSDGTALAVGLPPVPAAEPRLAVPETAAGDGTPVSGVTVLLAPPVAVPRPVRRCGNCRAAGHTRPACPRLTGALPLPQL